MNKEDKYFLKRHILIKMAKALLILLMMADSNQPHMDKIRFMVLIFDDHIIIYMSQLKDEDYCPP